MVKDIKAASKALYRALELAEGDLAAAAYRETHSPPFKAGVAVQHHMELRAILGEYQWVRDE